MISDRKNKSISRRDFIKGAVVGAGGIAAAGFMAGCGNTAENAESGGSEEKQYSSYEEWYTDWLDKPVEIPDSKIVRTLKADVVIVGAGVSGLNAARAAAESGASVIVIEKASTYQYRSGQYGIIDSKIQRQLGIKIDIMAAILENMRQMGYRPYQRLWKIWAERSGEAFDWLLELAPDVEVIPHDALSYDENKIVLQPLHFPPPAGFDPAKENSPAYPTVLVFLPDQGKMLKRVYDKCLDLGCKFLFSTWAQKLIRPNNDGRVEGVICETLKGEYIKVLAKKGIILATGDFGSNKKMLAAFVPWALTFKNLWPNRDAKGNPTNTGDGHRMGVWAGAKLEDGPFVPMTHALGGPLGVDAFFLANTEGKRFMNEDVTGQQLSNALYRQPGNFAWQIFDDKWPEQISLMGVSHGSVNHWVSDDKNPGKLKNNMSIGKSEFVSREDVNNYKGIVIANTLEELVSKLGLSQKAQKTLLESIKRYSELCKKGIDEDFGKTQKRLFPIETPPFYAAKIEAGPMLVCLGGLTCDPDTGIVLDRKYKEIEGLYAVGNTMGGRFLVDYPVVTPGISHGTAVTYGRLVGMTVAKL